MTTINRIVSRNVKHLRTAKGLSLEELANLSGVSKSMLVQIERGSGNPSLSTLWKIANGMQVPFDTLVAQPKEPVEIVRLADIDPILGNAGAVKNYALFPDTEGRHFSVYLISVQPGGHWQSEPHLRSTVEFITVFSGMLELTVAARRFSIGPGESVRFNADVPHTYYNNGSAELVFHNILYNP